MRKNLVLLAIVGVILVLFTGCSPAAKSEAEILKDLNETVYYRDFYIDEISITKRQTDAKEKTDKVFVEARMLNSDKSVKGTISYIVTYGLYNEGWIMDSYEEDSGMSVERKFTPLSVPEYSDDDLNKLSGYAYIANVDTAIIGSSASMENGEITYQMDVITTYKYATTNSTVEVTFYFDYDNGFWQGPYTSVISEETVWDIAGTYTYTTRNDWGEQEHTIDISEDFFYGDYSSVFQYATLYELSFISPGDLFANYIECWADNKLKAGYSISFSGNFNYYSCDYCLVQDSQWADALFIGKDSIALYSYNNNSLVYTDDYNKNVTFTLLELHRAN